MSENTEIKSTVRLKKNLILKKIFKFLEFYYKEIKIISIDLVEDEVSLYIDNRHHLNNKEIVELQMSIKKYTNNEFALNITKVNIINL
ncbi:MAG: hypothetical protein ACK5HR_01510 [Mycoplasmatales bacterium]